MYNPSSNAHQAENTRAANKDCKILGDTEQGDAQNLKLSNQKARLLRYHFTPTYVPGGGHLIPNPISRWTYHPYKDPYHTTSYAACKTTTLATPRDYNGNNTSRDHVPHMTADPKDGINADDDPAPGMEEPWEAHDGEHFVAAWKKRRLARG